VLYTITEYGDLSSGEIKPGGIAGRISVSITSEDVVAPINPTWSSACSPLLPPTSHILHLLLRAQSLVPCVPARGGVVASRVRGLFDGNCEMKSSQHGLGRPHENTAVVGGHVDRLHGAIARHMELKGVIRSVYHFSPRSCFWERKCYGGGGVGEVEQHHRELLRGGRCGCGVSVVCDDLSVL